MVKEVINIHIHLMKKSVLVISDLHYGDLAGFKEFGKSEPATEEDLNSVAKKVVTTVKDNKHEIDMLFVLGDLTSRGSPTEFETVYRFILILAEQLSIELKDVYITYGNHDVDWEICNIKSEPPEEHLAYCVTAANLGGMFAPPNEFDVYGPVLGCGVTNTDGLDIITLNSGIECYSSHSIKHGRLGQLQFEWVKDELSKFLKPKSTKIVILHHHLLSLPYKTPHLDLSALEEGANTLQILGDLGVDLVLHGHRHHPIVFTAAETSWKKPITFICAGSFGVGPSERADGRLPNTFYVLDFETEQGKENLVGKISTYERNSSSDWTPLNPNYDEYPLNYQQWFGSHSAMIESTKEVKALLTVAEKNLITNEFHMLPEYNDLELCLRCIDHMSMNDIFKLEAKSLNIKITGKYPDNCMVTR